MTRALRCVLVAVAVSLPAVRAQEPAAIAPSAPIKLFDGKSLANFEPWLVDHHSSDPQRVFSVVDQIDGAPAIRISGQVMGRAPHEGRVSRLPVGRRVPLGRVTWGDRKDRARDSGVLLHAQGRLGNTGKDFNGPWLRSIEFQIIEGGVGDILPVAGLRGEMALTIQPTVTATTRKDRDGETVYRREGDAEYVLERAHQLVGPRARIGRTSSDFAGAQDVESPGFEWTHIEAVVDGGNLTYFVNGKLRERGDRFVVQRAARS